MTKAVTLDETSVNVGHLGHRGQSTPILGSGLEGGEDGIPQHSADWLHAQTERPDSTERQPSASRCRHQDLGQENSALTVTVTKP